jgi:hypothetical protein
MNAVNGIPSWLETHFEVIYAITSYLETAGSTPYRIRQQKGIGGLYELAEDLADEFERLNMGRHWNGEFFEAIDCFLYERLK